MIDKAQRKDSIPNVGLSRSLMKPTVSGPKPNPTRLITRKKIAEVSARIEAGTRLCATAIDGPKYTLCREAHKPKQVSERTVFCRNIAAAAKGIVIRMA